ncbi:superoxide dismutase, Cu-Zn family [Lentzea albidocapillata subsp. violacea]|uniref:Superoxide dismutase, Cu-Zn family n=1 Tax=Lentzea albidocapillata subsp. violacea TaxID=128104 RepID=A0A1G9RCD1_9PSEU|nr:superoxide dismutase family protein [Lentzea albidocapillata]SDM20969.1 superoxide dismutase, Cu-Zn family [Lentzea albidocapillata subsp. violacea]
MRATVATLAGAVLLIGGLTACSSEAPPSAPAVTPVAETEVAAPAASGDQPKGITYDVARIPVGAKLSTGSSVGNGQTTVELKVSGLLPGTKYGSHVHTKPCGAKPADSGPHYQHTKDPVSPSVDPQFANAENEIWLDFTTDAQGGATARATVRWEFRKGEANSVVVHAAHTSTEHGKAGTAGDRLACLTAAF